jgi:phosphoglycerate kinase
MRTLKDIDVKNKKVLVRCDFNVPIDGKSRIKDDYRILQTVPTIKYLLKEKAALILMSHLGDPKGKRISSLSLRPVGKRLSELLKKEVILAEDCVGKEVEKKAKGLKPGQILLLENLRFHKEEEEGDEKFSEKLACLADIYVNDAFGASHRAHASITRVPRLLPSAAGLLLEKEIDVLSRVIKKPKRPLVAVVGGVKILSKIKAINNFLKEADHVLFGGKIFEPILQVKGVIIGRPWPQEEVAKAVEKINITDSKIHLPVDAVISLSEAEEEYSRKGGAGAVRSEENIFDIGPETAILYSNLLKEAKTIIWSGPMGFFEKKSFAEGSKAVAEAIIKNKKALKVAGGGDTNAFLSEYGLRDKFDHVSTGGGAMLEFFSGNKLPGLEALSERKGRDSE